MIMDNATSLPQLQGCGLNISLEKLEDGCLKCAIADGEAVDKKGFQLLMQILCKATVCAAIPATSLDTQSPEAEPGSSTKMALSMLERVEVNSFPAVSSDMIDEKDSASAESLLTQMQSLSLRIVFHDIPVAQEDRFRKLISFKEPKMQEATRNAWILRIYYVTMQEFLVAQASLQFQPLSKASDSPPQRARRVHEALCACR